MSYDVEYIDDEYVEAKHFAARSVVDMLEQKYRNRDGFTYWLKTTASKECGYLIRKSFEEKYPRKLSANVKGLIELSGVHVVCAIKAYTLYHNFYTCLDLMNIALRMIHIIFDEAASDWFYTQHPR